MGATWWVLVENNKDMKLKKKLFHHRNLARSFPFLVVPEHRQRFQYLRTFLFYRKVHRTKRKEMLTIPEHHQSIQYSKTFLFFRCIVLETVVKVSRLAGHLMEPSCPFLAVLSPFSSSSNSHPPQKTAVCTHTRSDQISAQDEWRNSSLFRQLVPKLYSLIICIPSASLH